MSDTTMLPESAARVRAVARRALRVVRQAAAQPVTWLLVLVAGSVQTWFPWGGYFVAGDNGPFVRGLDGVTRGWSGDLAGTGSSSYGVARFVEGAFVEAVGWFGGPGWVAQRAYYTCVMLAMVAAAYWMLRGIGFAKGAATCGAAVVFLNPFHITTLPNALPATAIAVLCAVLGAAVRLRRNEPVPGWLAIAISVGAGNISRNPPLLVLAAMVSIGVLAWSVRGSRGGQRTAGFTGLVVLGSLFWAVPLLLHYLTGMPGLRVVAETNVTDWSWTQRRSGPVNVMSLVATWVWGDPNVLPATHTLASWPWRPVKFALPLLVLLSLAFTRRRRLAGSVGAMAAVLVVLCSGTNFPFAAINKFLNAVIPGFWLFRQPMAKFGVLLVIVYAVIIAMGAERLFASIRHRLNRRGERDRIRAVGAAWLSVVLALGAAGFSHPLYTGSVVPGERQYLPSSRVHVPESWLAAGRWLDTSSVRGSVLVLPLSEYYQRGTTWGYYGVDDLMTRVSSRRALYSLPGGYYSAGGSADALMQAAEDAVLTSDGAGLARVAQSLGVGIIAVREDVTRKWGRDRVFADPASLIRGASATSGLEESARFEHVRFFTFKERPKQALSAAVDGGASAEETADVVAATAANVAVLQDEGARSFVWSPRDRSSWSNAAAADVSATPRPRAPLWWRAEKVDGGLRFSLASEISVNGTPLSGVAPWFEAVQGRVVGLQVSERTLRFTGNVLVFEATPGDSLVPLVTLSAPAVLRAGPKELGNCNNYDKNSLEEAGISVTSEKDAFVLRAESGSACAIYALPQPARGIGMRGWEVRGSWETISGASERPARACVWLRDARRCAVGSLDNMPESGVLEELMLVPARVPATNASLVLYAEHPVESAVREVAVRWSGVTVSVISTGLRMRGVPAVESVPSVRSSGAASASVDTVAMASLVGPFQSEVSDCNRYDALTPAQAGLSVRRTTVAGSPVLELGALRHSACISAPVFVQPGVSRHVISFSHRSLSGRGGRWCLLRVGGEGCIARGSLTASNEWRTETREVTIPDVGVEEEAEYRLFLYADGLAEGVAQGAATLVQYRDVRVRQDFPMHVVFTGNEEIAIAITPVREAWAAGWEPRTERMWSRHLVVDGWSNGWEFLGEPVDSLGARYRYDTAVTIAVWSLLPAVLLAIRRGLLRAGSRVWRTLRRVLERLAGGGV